MIDISHQEAKNKECYDIYIKSTVGGSCGAQHIDSIARAMGKKMTYLQNDPLVIHLFF